MKLFSRNELFSRRLLILSGKGGIGKSLVTAALGQAMAESGLKVLIVERSDQEQLAPLFGVERVGHRETEIRPNLFAINLDSTKCFEEYVVKQLGQKKLFEKVFSNNVVRTFLNTIPGLGESMLLGRIFYTCELQDPRPYDVVLFDAPASGHMQNLMSTPDAIINSGIGGPLVREVRRVRDFLADHDKVGAIIVTVPEELVISEVKDFIPKLQEESPAEILGVMVNRSVSPADVDSIQRLKDDPRGMELESSLRFIRTGVERLIKNQETLLSELTKMSSGRSNLHVGLLPELGVIQEPLADGFGELFTRGAME